VEREVGVDISLERELQLHKDDHKRIFALLSFDKKDLCIHIVLNRKNIISQS
jgi:hypothetical protein